MIIEMYENALEVNWLFPFEHLLLKVAKKGHKKSNRRLAIQVQVKTGLHPVIGLYGMLG